MTLPFERLPLEILQDILDYLNHEHHRNLLAFACVSRSFYMASAPILFYTVSFVVREYNNLAEDVCTAMEGHLKKLQRANSNISHVRTTSNRSSQNADEDDDDNSPKFKDNSRGHLNLVPSSTKADTLPPTGVYETDEVWRPLADLIQQLPVLNDMQYRCRGQFPPCLLEALHRYAIQCRLYIFSFLLRSLIAPEIDPYEFKLVITPSLHSIQVEYEEINGLNFPRVPSYHRERLPCRLRNHLVRESRKIVISLPPAKTHHPY